MNRNLGVRLWIGVGWLVVFHIFIPDWKWHTVHLPP